MSGTNGLRGLTTIVNVTAVSSRALGRDPTRRSICWPNITGELFTVSPVSPVVAGVGFVLQAGNGPWFMTYEEFGDMICQEWYIITGGGGGAVPVVTAHASELTMASDVEARR